VRAFALACFFVVVVAVGAATVLDNFVQKSATKAFAMPSARV
jgi:hypothetical protein